MYSRAVQVNPGHDRTHVLRDMTSTLRNRKTISTPDRTGFASDRTTCRPSWLVPVPSAPAAQRGPCLASAQTKCRAAAIVTIMARAFVQKAARMPNSKHANIRRRKRDSHLRKNFRIQATDTHAFANGTSEKDRQTLFPPRTTAQNARKNFGRAALL